MIAVEAATSGAGRSTRGQLNPEHPMPGALPANETAFAPGPKGYFSIVEKRQWLSGVGLHSHKSATGIRIDDGGAGSLWSHQSR